VYPHAYIEVHEQNGVSPEAVRAGRTHNSSASVYLVIIVVIIVPCIIASTVFDRCFAEAMATVFGRFLPSPLH